MMQVNLLVVQLNDTRQRKGDTSIGTWELRCETWEVRHGTWDGLAG
jgi:hypothetical protein